MRKTPGVQPRILCWFGDIPPFYPCAARPATINTRSRLPCQDAVAIWSKCSPQGLKSLRENSYCVVPSGLIPSGDLRFFSTSLKALICLFLCGTTKVVP
jgi:hypothetical protein